MKKSTYMRTLLEATEEGEVFTAAAASTEVPPAAGGGSPVFI